MTESIRRKKTIVFAGGGTGGHLLPGIAVAEQLGTLDDFQLIFVGSSRTVEQQIIQNSGYQHLSLPASPTSDLKRSPVRFFWNNSRAFLQAIRFFASRNTVRGHWPGRVCQCASHSRCFLVEDSNCFIRTEYYSGKSE